MCALPILHRGGRRNLERGVSNVNIDEGAGREVAL